MIFGALFCIGLFILELIVRTRPGIFHDRAAIINKSGNNVETLYFGSSITFWGISPELADSTELNLAYNSQTPDASYYILKNNLEKFPNLKRVVIELASFTFFDPPLEESHLWQYWTDYTIFLNTDKHSRLSKYGFEISNPSEFRRRLLPWVEQDEVSQDSRGHADYRPLSQRWYKWPESVEWVVPTHLISDWKWKSYNVEYFEKLIILCLENGIEPVVVVFPAYKTYRDMMEGPQWKETLKELKELQAKHGFIVKDLYADIRFGEEDFFDVVHLTTDKGARKMWRILNEELSN